VKGKRRFNLISLVKEEVIGSENTFHAWCVLAAIAVIIGMGLLVRSSPVISFQGIAGSEESSVSAARPGEIRRVHVIEGQKVSRGDVLVEIDTGGEEGKTERDYVLAETAGVVTNVTIQRGERVPAFTTLLSISPEGATYVKGYVHETLRATIEIGTQVKVRSVDGGASTEGEVVSLGGRFVKIPDRLKSSLPLLGAEPRGAYGREVTVRVATPNSFLMDEKVMISPASSFFRSFLARADAPAGANAESSPEMGATKPVRVAPAVKAISHIELSGAIYLEDLKKYLVVSDDTDDERTPYVFLLNEEGEIEEAPLVIPGVAKLKDMESISSDGEYTYVLTSLWGNGRALKKSGGSFVRFHRQGATLANGESLLFEPLLRSLIEKSREPGMIALVRAGVDHIEIEAHAVLNGDLYIGLKAPRTEDKRSVILRIRDVNGLFAGSPNMRVELWRTVLFPGQDGDHRISDLAFVDGSIYLTTTRKKDPGGAFWVLEKEGNEARQLRTFAFERPEGVAYNKAKNEFLLVFDQGAAGSRYLFVSGQATNREQ